MRLTLSTMPEELLERILAFAVTPSSPSAPHRPSWHVATPNATKSGIAPHATSLLVSRKWLRIATPAFYRHIVLRSDRQTATLAYSLCTNPELGRWVRSIRVEGTYQILPDVVRFCPALEEFDMTVDSGPSGPPAPIVSSQRPPTVDAAVVRFCTSLSCMHRLRNLVIRKNAYLTLPGPTHIFEELGKAIRRWKYLECVQIAFRFSPSPASASFAASLASAPRLRTVSALLPTVWNTALLEISQNPSLERIHIGPRSELVASQLFMTEARKYPRLMELITTGTPELPVESPARSRCWPGSSSLPSPGFMSPASVSAFPAHWPNAYAHAPYHAPSPAPYQHLSQHSRAKPQHARAHKQSSPRDPRIGLPTLASSQRHGAPAVRRMSGV
ncbi:uncharacterized protein B0H18DRAFT_1039517 [Fomitopsis serialis]|uniref:uncharacterized protein n=1 Tax=Fomitopsis serialis TaxID=139415 RepID=UPI002007F906|nr:uncharacterized protein B0H18DRAFT_1039517 [Neoantrodia serialis]KAH9915996.1 hypothetical protein B0H18DRAFT_1039517 [Neoantrodia serialis]